MPPTAGLNLEKLYQLFNPNILEFDDGGIDAPQPRSNHCTQQDDSYHELGTAPNSSTCSQMPINPSINQSINQSIYQSINQSINQSISALPF